MWKEVVVYAESICNVYAYAIMQLLNNEMSSDDVCPPSNVTNSLTQSQPITAEEATLLSSRLLHSEETQRDIKQELSKMRHDCIRQQGAQVCYFCL